ncbi:MAG TPA: MFS transporter [Candidatus Bathyarchaeia archaeon]|nr:MFS transporter [Candidatus Bathyarchaeia archaeon]
MTDRKYLLLGSCWLFVSWLFAYRAMLIAFLPSIVSSLSLTNTMAGGLIGMLWTADSLAAYPSGLATAYLSRKRLLLLSIALSSSFMLLFVFSSSFPIMLISLFFAGLGFGAYYPLGISIISEKFRGGRLGTFIGLHETGVPIGMTIGPMIASVFMISNFSWNTSLFIGLFALPPIVVLLSSTIGRDKIITRSKRLWFKPDSWSIYLRVIILSICWVGLDSGFSSMIPVYMVDSLHVDISEAAFVFGATRFFGIAGIVIAGFLSDKFNKVRILLATASIATSAAVLIAIMPYNLVFAVAMAILAAASSSYWPLVITILSKISSMDDLPKIIGFQGLTCGLLGGGLTPVIIGYIADLINFKTAFIYPIALGLLGILIALSLNIAKKGSTRE